MSAPHIDQINVVLADVAAASDFLAGLGVAMNPIATEWSDWAAHHQDVAAPDDAGAGAFDIDLDSSAFARHWGGLPADFVGVVLNLRVSERAEVDRLYAQALASGADSRREPYDAFWGARFALVGAPGPMMLGVMSAVEPAKRSAGPAIEDFD